MVKNNLKALSIHIIISFSSIFILLIFFVPGGKWASEEAAIRHHNQMMFAATIFIVIALIAYSLAGGIFLIYRGSLLKNLLSAVLVAIIGALLWVLAYKIDFEAISVSYSSWTNSKLWQFYFCYNGYSAFYADETNMKNYLLILLFSFLPTIAMTFGILARYIFHKTTLRILRHDLSGRDIV